MIQKFRTFMKVCRCVLTFMTWCSIGYGLLFNSIWCHKIRWMFSVYYVSENIIYYEIQYVQKYCFWWSSAGSKIQSCKNFIQIWSSRNTKRFCEVVLNLSKNHLLAIFTSWVKLKDVKRWLFSCCFMVIVCISSQNGPWAWGPLHSFQNLISYFFFGDYNPWSQGTYWCINT